MLSEYWTVKSNTWPLDAERNPNGDVIYRTEEGRQVRQGGAESGDSGHDGESLLLEPDCRLFGTQVSHHRTNFDIVGQLPGSTASLF